MTRRLLVVEDDPGQRELLCTLLEEHGYSCTGVEDGKRALEVLSLDETLDAVLLDMVLPRLNGHEFLRELRARGEQRLGVIVVSGFGPVSRFSDRLPLVHAVVQKPVDLRALLAAVESCVERASPDATA
ncbi:MAG TPA: response regulator [Myxococcaceae bacterium]|nr:response regulator [Myxococcaceae bacterium]